MFNGIIQTILVAFSMTMYRACTGMLSYENYDFILLKTAKLRHVHYSFRAHGTDLFLKTILSFTRSMFVKVAI